MGKRWYIGNAEITLREVLASITIIAVMILIGFVISGRIEEYQMDKNSDYYKAVHVTDPEMFQYGMETNIGNAFVYGNLEPADTVTYPEIGGAYLYVKKVEEHYNMHTRTYTTTDSKGHTRTHTEIYWSWDYAGEEELHSQKIKFLGVEMGYDKIQMPEAEYIDTIKESSHVRYKYYGCKGPYTGTIYTDLRDGTLSGGSHFYNNKNIETTVDSLTSGAGVIIFWTIWIVLIAIVVYGFYYLDNEWLE